MLGVPDRMRFNPQYHERLPYYYQQARPSAAGNTNVMRLQSKNRMMRTRADAQPNLSGTYGLMPNARQQVMAQASNRNVEARPP